MGYDDNTPLTGVTGGGLPAEIWRETMIRVEDGLPIRPLPGVDAGAAASPRRRRRADPVAERRDRRPQRGAERAEGPLRPQLTRPRRVAGVGEHPSPLRRVGRVKPPTLGARPSAVARVDGAGRGRCREAERAGARIVSLVVFGLLAENDCSPGFKAV